MRASSGARRRARRRLLAGLAASIALACRGVRAFDAKSPVTLIVPGPAGVSTDRLGRLLADALSTILEVPVRVENVAGEGGVAGTNAIASGPRDGSMLGLAISSAIIGGKLLSRSARFSPVDDFEWFTILGTFPTALVLPAKSPYASIEAWLAAAREAPSPWVYASIGSGSAGHLAGAYLRLEQGAKLVHRTVESADERYALLADGKINALFDGVPNAMNQAPRAGHRIVAVTSAARVPALPQVPCFGELWRQWFDVWIGLVTPKGLDHAAQLRFASAIGVLVSEPRYADSLRAVGLTFLGLSGRGTIAYVESEFLRDAKLIAFLNDEGQRR